MTLLTDALKSRGSLIGTLISVPSTAIAEALSTSGLDWLFFDLEHSVMSLAEVQAMIQAMRGECLSFIRLEDALPVYVKKALDTGCSGIIVPQVNSAAIARAVVAAGKFPPVGSRSVGLGRALGYGTTLAEAVRADNERISIVVQIEHVAAVEAVDEIAAVEGVDALFIGPYDLSGSLGIPGQVNDARVQSAIDRTVAAAIKVGKPAGIFVGTADAARKAIERGIRFVAVGADLLRLAGACKSMCEEIRG